MLTFASIHRWFHRPDRRDPQPPPPSNDSVDAEVQFLRGLRFATGSGSAQDYLQAAHWYTLAAEQNHGLAQFNLAVMYDQGQGVRRDAPKALMWMTRAANSGDAAAQFRLGMQQHLAGRKSHEATAPETRIEALKWVRLAASQGYRGAARAAELLALGMPFAEVSEGSRRVEAFVTKC